MRHYIRQLIAAVTIVAVLVGTSIVPARVSALPQRDVGMWYSTLYSNEKNYIWNYGNGVNSNRQMVGDLNGDGKADVGLFYNSSGTWHGLISSGNGFSLQANMAQGHGSGSTKQFLADVDGDGYADAVAYWDIPGHQGVWRIWYNNHQGDFTQDNTIRLNGFGAGSSYQFMADINGDGAADAVAAWPGAGKWVVALGNMGSQSGATLTYTGNYWKDGVGVGATNFLVGDATGDGKADAVVITPTQNSTGSGDWNVSANTGNYASAETNSQLWVTGHGVGSTSQFLADVNGDGKQDAVVMTQDANIETHSIWYVAYSRYVPGCATGVCFDASSAGNVWLQRHGYSAKLQSYNYGPSQWQALGDFDGDGQADPLVFHNNSGEWRVMPSTFVTGGGARDPDQMNYWQSNLIRYLPIVGGVARQYDSSEPAVIDEQLGQMGAAGVNFLLLDLTNGPQGWYYNRGLDVCDRMQVYNQTHTPLKMALAIGGFQYDKSTDSAVVGPDVESEVGDILSSSIGFVNNPRCQGLFYGLNGKPMLTMYFASQEQRDAWINYTGDKTNSNQFTVKYTYGSAPYQAGNVSYPCSTKNSTTACNAGMPLSSPAPSEYSSFSGWGVPYGTLINPTNNSMAVVMPGWNTNNPTSSRFISRTQSNTADGFYTNWGWNLINNLSPANKPTIVIVNSYNEYAEETAVAPTETNQTWPSPPLQGRSETWPSQSYYWNDTANLIQLYKSN